MKTNYFCAWWPQFAAWTLEQSETALRGRAFAVCERGAVVAASDEALRAGVKAGMTSGRAQGRLSSLLLVARERTREELAWAEIQRAFYGLTPCVEPIQPGLLFADVAPDKVVPFLESWKMRGGAASNRATAHMAALGAPKGRARLVSAGDERAFADGVALEELSATGIDAKTLRRLGWFGWHNVGQLRPLSRRQLEEQIGPLGALLHRFAQGERESSNLRPVETWKPPAEIMAALSFELPAREPSHWDGALDALLHQLCVELNGRSAQALEVTAQTAVAPVSARRVLKEPLAAPDKLRRPLDNALAEALETLAPLPPVVSALEVRLGALVSPPAQTALFDDGRAASPDRLRRTLEGLKRASLERWAASRPRRAPRHFPKSSSPGCPRSKPSRAIKSGAPNPKGRCADEIIASPRRTAATSRGRGTRPRHPRRNSRRFARAHQVARARFSRRERGGDLVHRGPLVARCQASGRASPLLSPDVVGSQRHTYLRRGFT